MKGLAGNSGEWAAAIAGFMNEIPLEINACLKLGDIAEELGKTFKLFEGKRMEALHEWCKKDKDGKMVTTNGKENGPADFEDGAQDEYAKAFSLIANEDIEYKFDPIPIKLLTHRASGKPYVDKDGEPVTVLPSIMMRMKPLLEKDKATKKETEGGESE